MKETVGLKLEAETAAKFKEIQKKHVSAQEFIENLLSVYLEKKIETNADSKVYREKNKVKKALASVERVVSAYLEIAASEKEEAVENAENEKKAAEKKIIELKKKIDEQNTALNELKKKYDEQTIFVKNLQESAETILELKTAWQKLEDSWEREREALITQIAQLKEGKGKEKK